MVSPKSCGFIGDSTYVGTRTSHCWNHNILCDVIGVLRPPSRERFTPPNALVERGRQGRRRRRRNNNEPALHADLPQHHAIAGVLAPHRPGITSAILSERRGGEERERERERERDDIVLSKERARLWGRQASIGTRAAGRRPPSSSE